MSESKPPHPSPPEALEDLPCSAEIVWRVLEEAERPLSTAEIKGRTARPRRTIRYGLRELIEAELADSRTSTEDPRVLVYSAEGSA